MKSYGQFCGLARALDHVGDRWTLLIVRELLLDDATYGALLRALDTIPTNLLARRLGSLQHDGLVECVDDPSDRRRRRYRLTERGRTLEPALLALVSWGALWMRSGRGDDRFDVRWGFLALRALLEGRTVAVAGVIEVRAQGHRWVITAADGDVSVGRDLTLADVTLDADGEVLLGVAAGELSWKTAKARGLRTSGRHELARAVLVPSRDDRGERLHKSVDDRRA